MLLLSRSLFPFLTMGLKDSKEVTWTLLSEFIIGLLIIMYSTGNPAGPRRRKKKLIGSSYKPTSCMDWETRTSPPPPLKQLADLEEHKLSC